MFAHTENGEALLPRIHNENNIIGSPKAAVSDYDKIQVTLLCLDGTSAGKENVIGMLDVALSNEMPAKEKVHHLESGYGIRVTDSLEGRIEAMCNYSKGVYDDGMEKGMEKGIEKGIIGAVSILRGMGETPEKIIDRLVQQYGLSKEEAAKYVREIKD